MIWECIEDALRSVRNNKLRTALTMLGIIIGIGSVIAVLTIGAGMQAYVQNEMDAFSGNVAMLLVDSTKTSEKITPEDIRLLNTSIPGITGVTYVASGFGVLTGKRAAVDVSVSAGSAVMERYSANKMEHGRYFTDNEVENHAAVCVVMERDARKLCGTSDAVGQTLTLTIAGMSKELSIVGVRENYSDAILKMMDEAEDYVASIDMPYTAYADLAKVDMESGMDQALLFADTGSDTDEITRMAVRLLKNRHGIREDKTIRSVGMSDVSGRVNSIFGAITTFLTFVAGISLLVGGIGVMNIMLVSVTERTREIGIRKSIGARTGAIMIQFLAEAAVISLMGGMVGIVVGIIAAAIGCHIFEFKLVVHPSTVLLATVSSTAIGLFFGLHPARKAAKMRPIDALRF